MTSHALRQRHGEPEHRKQRDLRRQRLHEADRAGDLCHLGIAMRSRVGSVRRKPADRPLLDLRYEILHLTLPGRQTERPWPVGRRGKPIDPTRPHCC